MSGGVIGIDTSAFVYHLEANPERGPVVGDFFADLARGLVEGVTSVLTLMELLVRPLRIGRLEAARDFESFLHEYPHLSALKLIVT